MPAKRSQPSLDVCNIEHFEGLVDHSPRSRHSGGHSRRRIAATRTFKATVVRCPVLTWRQYRDWLKKICLVLLTMGAWSRAGYTFDREQIPNSQIADLEVNMADRPNQIDLS
jgi:hypothetical protein